MFTHRRLGPLGLISLGSDPNPPLSGDIDVNDMQAARYESGLDNSPMYDGNYYFNNQTCLSTLLPDNEFLLDYVP